MRGAGNHRGIIEKYRKRLPVGPRTPVVTLLEGNTPLVPADRLARKLHLREGSLYLKLEGLNPTGSFKDRGMTVAVSKALEEGSRAVICASTGNTAASAAAYAARAGLKCLVLLPYGKVALGKLAQSLIHGAQVVQVRGNFDQAFALARRASSEHRITLVNSVNPYRLQGQKTAAFEVCEALGRPPDLQFMPVGNAGNITAYWMGYKEWREATSAIKRRATSATIKLPRMMGFQAAGAAPLVLGRPVADPRTVATAIRIGNPASWEGALKAKDESGGVIDRVTDREILAAYRLLAEEEGVFCEPSSAAGVAGLIRYARRREIRKAGRIVCILTGNGLKDPETPHRFRYLTRTIRPEMRELQKLLK